MAIKYLADIDLDNNQLVNALLQKAATPPKNPIEGRIYYDETSKALYTFNGKIWTSLNDKEQKRNDTYLFDNYTNSLNTLLADHSEGIIDLNGYEVYADNTIINEEYRLIKNGNIKLASTIEGDEERVVTGFTLTNAAIVFEHCNIGAPAAEANDAFLFDATNSMIWFDFCNVSIDCIDSKTLFGLVESSLTIEHSDFEINAIEWAGRDPNISLTLINFISGNESSITVKYTNIRIANDISTDSSGINNTCIKIEDGYDPPLMLEYSSIWMHGQYNTAYVLNTNADNTNVFLLYCQLDGDININLVSTMEYVQDMPYSANSEFIYFDRENQKVQRYKVLNNYTSIDLETDLTNGNIEFLDSPSFNGANGTTFKSINAQHYMPPSGTLHVQDLQVGNQIDTYFLKTDDVLLYKNNTASVADKLDEIDTSLLYLRTSTVIDLKSTEIVLDPVEDNTIYKYGSLDRLSIVSLINSDRRTLIYFNTSASFTALLVPAEQTFIGSSTVAAEKMYKLEIENGTIHVLEYGVPV